MLKGRKSILKSSGDRRKRSLLFIPVMRIDVNISKFEGRGNEMEDS